MSTATLDPVQVLQKEIGLLREELAVRCAQIARL